MLVITYKCSDFLCLRVWIEGVKCFCLQINITRDVWFEMLYSQTTVFVREPMESYKREEKKYALRDLLKKWTDEDFFCP